MSSPRPRTRAQAEAAAPSPAACQAAAAACACFNVRRTARQITQIYDDALAPVSVSSGQFVILLAMRILGTATMLELASAVSLDRSALSRALQPLVARKLVRVQVGLDRRCREVALTTAGLLLLADGAPHWERAQERLQTLLGGEQFTALLQTSQRSFELLTA